MISSIEVKTWRIKTGAADEEFAVYFVEVQLASGLTWKIEKRYKQFRAFRREIERVLPELSDLEFPGKSFFWNLSERTLKYRASVLARYLQAVMAVDAELVELTSFRPLAQMCDEITGAHSAESLVIEDAALAAGASVALIDDANERRGKLSALRATLHENIGVQ